MKKELQELFNGLNHLCETNEAFYFSEQDYKGTHIVRSYSYRLASYTDFQLPYAKDARGTAFVYNKETKEWNLFCRAYQKFANLGEWITKEEYIKNNNPICSFEKLDGSLILVGIIENELVAKSKTSINSDHAKRANELISKNPKLQKFLKDEINDNLTPVMELVGPGEFRIVLPYKEDELIYLGSVEQIDYAVYTIENTEKFKEIAGIRCAEINDFTWDKLTNIQETSKPDIEGFVVKTESGFVKVKVRSYVQLHHTKDKINNLSNLIPLILNDNLDDLIGMLQDDPDALEYIAGIQDKISKKFNHYVQEYIDLRGLYFNLYRENRKDFALKHSKNNMFRYIMQSLKGSFRDVETMAEEAAKDYILKRCRTLSLAEEFIKD